MQPSDSLPPSATALVPLASGLPRCRRWFCAWWPTTRAPANASCVGDDSPALRKAGMCRGEARASQVPGPSSSYVPWSNTPPDTALSSPTCRRGRYSLQVIQHPGHPGSDRFRGRMPHGPHARCRRFARPISETIARLATGLGGLTLRRTGFAPAGRRTKFHEGIATSNSL